MTNENPMLSEYLLTISMKIEVIAGLIRVLKNNYNIHNLEVLQKEIHKITNSSKLFGFTEANKLSQSLEIHLISNTKNFYLTEPSKEWLSELEKFPELLEKAFSIAKEVKKEKVSPTAPIKTEKTWRPSDEPETKRIIIVDDDEDILNLLSLEFHRLGFEVDTFQDGTTALTFMLKEDNCNDVFLVILDRMLPDMDGLDILQQFKRSHPKIPVLILSALDSEKDIISGLQDGAVDYITKPFSVFMLLQKSINLLRTKTG